MPFAEAAPHLVNRRFLLLESLGRGGMGCVYRAFDRAEERIVALKLPRESGRAGPDHPWTEEFLAWTRLRHPNIVRVFDLDRVAHGPFPAGTPYLVLESFPGVPVHRGLGPGRATIHELRSFASQALDALAHVHDRDLVHRDLKPGNLLVARTGGRYQVKLTDFGLATATGFADEPGRVSGSLPYVSPEAVLGGRVDARSDLYGLGILLYYLSVGRLPCASDEPEAILRWHLRGPEVDSCAARPELPVRWGRFIRRLTSRDPDDRPRSATDALGLLGGQAPPAGRSRRIVVGRAEIARVRLAMDEARLGGRRVLRLPSSNSSRRDMIRETRNLSRIFGVSYHLVRRDRNGSGSNLGRVVLELLVERNDGILDVVRRHGLHRGLPLELLGGLPLWDRSRAGRQFESRHPDAARVVSRGVAAFVLNSACDRSLALVFEPEALCDPLTRETASFLLGEVEQPATVTTDGGGLLLLVPAVFSASDRC